MPGADASKFEVGRFTVYYLTNKSLVSGFVEIVLLRGRFSRERRREYIRILYKREETAC